MSKASHSADQSTPRKKAVRLVDIAKQAGVSVSVVGSVLNGGRGNSRVAEATADKIIAIAKELNYRASPTAQQLRGKRSRVFGLLVASAAIRDSTKGPAKVGSVLYFLLPQLEQQALYQSISGWTMNPFL